MDFLQVIVVASFDVLFIFGELAVEAVGYTAWVIFTVVYLKHRLVLTVGDCSHVGGHPRLGFGLSMGC